MNSELEQRRFQFAIRSGSHWLLRKAWAASPTVHNSQIAAPAGIAAEESATCSVVVAAAWVVGEKTLFAKRIDLCNSPATAFKELDELQCHFAIRSRNGRRPF